MEKSKLLIELKKHLSDNKVDIFDTIANDRMRHVTLVLEDIFQPHNTSAVIRSCDCFGIQDIHIIENRNEFNHNKEIDMGSIKWLDIHQYNSEKNNTKSTINKLKKQGYKIVSTTPYAKKTIDELDLSQPIAIMMGTELTGLSKEALELSDEKVKLPMYGFTESFNISVCAALILSEITAKLRRSDIPWRLNEEEQTEIKIEWCKRQLNRGYEIASYIEKSES
jgi:tRNA (guanosine-2'-O-)-methyltransferase